MLEVCVKIGASRDDLVPFEKYAAAAESLTRPASAARAPNNGAPNIERADKLVQFVAKQNGMSHPALDAIVALVDRRLEANRKIKLPRLSQVVHCAEDPATVRSFSVRLHSVESHDRGGVRGSELPSRGWRICRDLA